MGSDTAVRAGCSMLNISALSLACFLPRAALASRSRASGARRAERRPRRAQWHRRGRQQRQHGCSGDATAC